MLCANCPPTFRAVSTDSYRNCPSRRPTTCTEHASKKIRPSKRLEFDFLLKLFAKLSWSEVDVAHLRACTHFALCNVAAAPVCPIHPTSGVIPKEHLLEVRPWAHTTPNMRAVSKHRGSQKDSAVLLMCN